MLKINFLNCLKFLKELNNQVFQCCKRFTTRKNEFCNVVVWNYSSGNNKCIKLGTEEAS